MRFTWFGYWSDGGDAPSGHKEKKVIMCKEWVKIPEFDKYEFNLTNYHVRSLTRDREMSCKQGAYFLRDNEGKIHRLQFARLVYAVTRGIQVADVPADVVVKIVDGKAVAYDKRSFYEENVWLRQKKAAGNPSVEYGKVKLWIDAILDSISRKDFGKIYSMLYEYKGFLISKMTRKEFAKRQEAEEIADMAIEMTYDGIVNGKFVVVKPEDYLWHCVMAFIKLRRMNRKNVLEYRRELYGRL